ncbi:MAG: ABC transporter substrate-binding protein [Bacillota bacterium]
MKRIAWFAAAFLVVALVVGGCGAPKQGDTAKKETTPRDELVLAIGGEPSEGFDPTTGWGRYGSPLFQSTLLARDKELRVVNDLAESWAVSEDGLTWTVTIRRDVKFSDGSPLTAEDVAFTFRTAAASGSIIDLTVLEDAVALDEVTVEFRLQKPQSTFINRLISTGIVPKHAYGPGYAENPIGSGPYRLVQWDRGQQLIVEANPHYYGPQPAFKKITFLYLGEDAAFAAAKAGQVDIAAVPHLFAKQTVPGMRLVAVKSVDNRGIMFPMVPSGQKTAEGYPVGNDVTADPAVRKAVNVAVDRRALVENVLEGFGSPAYTICDHLPWWNPETVIPDADPEAARQILAAAGWRDTNGDGVLEKNGLEARFNLIYPAGDQTRQSLALAVADMLKPIGLDIKVEGKSWDEIKTLMHSNAILFGWGSHDPLEMYNVYHGKNRGVGWYNTGFYHNPVVDAYMDKAMTQTREEEALAYWKKAQWDGSTGLSAKGDAPWAWLVNLDHCYLVREDLDIGAPRIQPHGHGWPITANILEWRWKE